MDNCVAPTVTRTCRVTSWTRTTLLFAVLACVPVSLLAQEDGPATLSFEEKVSYIIGHQFAGQLKSMGIDIQLESLLRGLREAVAGEACQLSVTEQQAVMAEFKKQRTEKQQADQANQARSQMSAYQRMQEEERPEAIRLLGPENAFKISLKKPDLMTFDSATDYYWVLDTNKGTIKVKLMPDVAPMHVTSTIYLTNKKYYDGTEFHRVIPGFMAQGGRAVKTSRLEWGPDYQYDGEFDPQVKHDRPYLLSMANRGPGTDSAQFFLTFVPTAHLDGKHTIFGEITEGKDVMKKLEAAGTPSGTPQEKLLLKKATIEEKPRG